MSAVQEVLAEMREVIAIAGSFDPLHAGHVDHIHKAKALGDHLVVITHPDEIQVKKKGYCFMPLEDRVAVLLALRDVDQVIVDTVDTDGTVAGQLIMLRPDVFAKGGDRVASSMPDREIVACQAMGIEIVYGVGGLLNSSSRLVEEVVGNYLASKGLIAAPERLWMVKP